MRTGENIRQRADGRFEARYIKDRNEKGRAIYGSCYGKTYEEAKAKRDKILDEKCLEDFVPQGIKLLVLGAGSHGQEVYEIASSSHVFEKIDFLDDDPSKTEAIGNWSEAETLAGNYNAAIVAVGHEKLRQLWSSKLVEMGYIIPILVHPTALISRNAKIGIGSVIGARVTVSSGAIIGTGCIISACVTIGRGAEIKDWVHIVEGGVVVQHSDNDEAED